MPDDCYGQKHVTLMDNIIKNLLYLTVIDVTVLIDDSIKGWMPLQFPPIFFFGAQPPVGNGLLVHEVSRSHTTTHYSRYDSSGRVISSLQTPLPDDTQHSQQTDIHTPGRIRTHDRSRRAAADLHQERADAGTRSNNNRFLNFYRFK